MPTDRDTTYKVVEMIAEEPRLPSFYEFVEVDADGRRRMLARAATLEELHAAVSVLVEADG